MDKLSKVENGSVVFFFFSEGLPSQNRLCRVPGVLLVVIFAHAPLPFSISWRYVA
jgi:hypothetical protein